MLIGLVKAPVPARYGRNYATTPNTADTYTILVSQHVVQQIPIYKSLLKEALSTKDPNEIPKIYISEVPATDVIQASAFIKTMNFLGGAAVPAVNTIGARAIDTLKSLLAVYDVCVVLKTEALEQAVLDRMAGYHYPNTDTFVEIAREVYGNTGPKQRAVDSSIGKLVKSKLAELLPR